MAVTLTSDQRAALRSGAIAIRTMVDLYLGSGRYSFWDGPAHQSFEGQTYLAAGALASVSTISFGSDLGAEGIEIVLDGSRLLGQGAGIDVSPTDAAALLATIHDETYHQRRIVVRFVFFAAETGAHVLTLPRFSGLIDQIEIRDEPGNEDTPGRALMVMKCESVARRYGRREGRVRSHEDQNEIYLGDDFFKHTSASVSQERNLIWGRASPGMSNVTNGGPGSGGPSTHFTDITTIYDPVRG